MLKKWKRVVILVQKRQDTYLKRMHLGIELHKIVSEALTLDAKNGNNM